MNHAQTVHQANLDLISAHVTDNKPVLENLRQQFTDIIQLTDGEDQEITNIKNDTLKRWCTFDWHLEQLHDTLIVVGPGKVIEMERPVGEDQYLVYLANVDGTVHHDYMIDDSKDIAHRIDPDFYLASVKGGPDGHYRIAYERWVEETIDRTPIYTGSIFLSIEAQIGWIEFGVDLSYRRDGFSDGRVQLTFSASGKLGAALKIVDASAGGELGVVVMHEFASAHEADRFLADLRDATLEGLQARLVVSLF